MDGLWQVVSSIPPGRVVSYGAVGRALPAPASGWMVGRWMAQCPEGVPWWRVVAATGDLPTHKRDPRLAQDQRRRLEAEGVEFDGERVAASMFWEP
jgi:methylated-DNA-protein-cysteine methyltransferase related protein